MLLTIAWCLTVLLMTAGLVGVVLPLIPGTTLILLAALLHKLLVPGIISWWTFAGIVALWGLSIVADLGGVVLGTRWFGGSKWGMAGASGGALVGVFFSLPALILGTILGAVAAEKIFAKKTDRAALKAGVGAATGFVISTVARLVCAFAMIGTFLVAALST
jgi:uncharacterized protein